MRIIEKGKKIVPYNIEHIKKCKYCGTKFAYKENDIEWDMCEEACIVCPVCGLLVYPSIFDRKIKEKNKK